MFLSFPQDCQSPPTTPSSPAHTDQVVLLSPAVCSMFLPPGCCSLFAQQPATALFQAASQLHGHLQSPALRSVPNPQSLLPALHLPPGPWMRAPAPGWGQQMSLHLPAPAGGRAGCSGRSSPSAELGTVAPAAPASSEGL